MLKQLLVTVDAAAGTAMGPMPFQGTCITALACQAGTGIPGQGGCKASQGTGTAESKSKHSYMLVACSAQPVRQLVGCQQPTSARRGCCWVSHCPPRCHPPGNTGCQTSRCRSSNCDSNTPPVRICLLLAGAFMQIGTLSAALAAHRTCW